MGFFFEKSPDYFAYSLYQFTFFILSSTVDKHVLIFSLCEQPHLMQPKSEEVCFGSQSTMAEKAAPSVVARGMR